MTELRLRTLDDIFFGIQGLGFRPRIRRERYGSETVPEEQCSDLRCSTIQVYQYILLLCDPWLYSP